MSGDAIHPGVATGLPAGEPSRYGGPLGLFLALCVAGALLPRVGTPDQDDPRLDTLFERLREAPSAERASDVEARIRSIWLETDDADVAALMELASTSIMLGRLGVALDTLDEVVRRAPEYAEGWYQRGAGHLAIGNFDRAVLDFRRALALEPRHFGAIADLGTTFLIEREADLAVDAFEEALAIHPRSPEIRARLERARAHAGDRAL